MSLFKPRRHEDIAVIVREAEKGNSFFVNRAAANGDLETVLPPSIAGLIVAVANQKFVENELNYRLPLTSEIQDMQQNIIDPHEDLAVRAFSLADGLSVIEQVRRHLRR